MVLELKQCSLRDVLNNYVKIADEKCVLVMIAVRRGLQYCHRYVKPENILMTGYDEIKLADFGLI